MRFVKSAKLAAVALAAAAGAALASAPANAATTPLAPVTCDRENTTQFQFEGFVQPWPMGCFKGSGDLDINVNYIFYMRAGDHSGYVVFADGSKVSFTKGAVFRPTEAGSKNAVHIHTD
ncbi:hypothetical protein AB8O64_24520 [Streptomyces sp. QH1-20]|uniref:hypothetical protein n=1 Tax=Streptomyces sp. QH1-20 TaxID=3240934 RepID=UPI003515AA88